MLLINPVFGTMERMLKIKHLRSFKVFHICSKLSRLSEKLTNVLFAFLVINISCYSFVIRTFPPKFMCLENEFKIFTAFFKLLLHWQVRCVAFKMSYVKLSFPERKINTFFEMF